MFLPVHEAFLLFFCSGASHAQPIGRRPRGRVSKWPPNELDVCAGGNDAGLAASIREREPNHRGRRPIAGAVTGRRVPDAPVAGGCLWLGELITENGVGNGVSIIIFAGIVRRRGECVARAARASPCRA